MSVYPVINQPVSNPPAVFNSQNLIQMFNNQNTHGETFCKICNENTVQITRRSYGTVTLLWCMCLFWTTGVFCCLPFCIDSCQDIYFFCGKCKQVKNSIPAKCC